MSQEGAGTGPLFEDGKADGAMRTIGEVSAAFGIKAHVLRYWEQQFPMLTPLKRSGGRRLYRAADIAMVETIDRLVNHEGYTLKGAQKAIQSGVAAKAVSAVSSDAVSSDAASSEVGEPLASQSIGAASAPPPEVANQLRAIRDRLAAALD